MIAECSSYHIKGLLPLFFVCVQACTSVFKALADVRYSLYPLDVLRGVKQAYTVEEQGVNGKLEWQQIARG